VATIAMSVVRIVGLLTGMSPMPQPIPATIVGRLTGGALLACDPVGIPGEGEREEHFARITRLLGVGLERTELPDGIAFRFSADLLPEVARFVENERRCCPFLAFSIELWPDAGEITLRMTGPEGVREFVAAEFKSPS
jgi:hypothetical protein